MIGATRRWVRHHRKGLAIGVGVVGAGYVVGQYVLSKISEARERMSSERIARENLRRRFEQNQADCTFTVLALLPTAVENVLEVLPVEEFTQELQKKRTERLARLSGSDVMGSEASSTTPSITDDDGRSLSSFQTESYIHTSQLGDSTTDGNSQRPRRSKAQLWNEVKISSITRAIVLLYTLSLLTLLTRVQLNLLGRRNYVSSVMSLASPQANTSTINLEDHDDEIGQAFGNDFETNRRYLTFSWWLLNRGWKDLMEKVRAAVEEVFGSLNPRDDITLTRFSELVLEVRKKVEGATEEERKGTKWLLYLLPSKEEEEMVLQESGVLSASTPSSPQTVATLRRLLDETSDLIDSPSFSRIFTLLNDEGFSTLVDKKCATHAFKSSSTSEPAKAVGLQSFSSSVTIVPAADSSALKTKLATVLAVVTREAHNIGNGTTPPNEYLVAMEQGVRELEAFAAVVYSSNFDLGLPPSGPDSIKLSGAAATSSSSTSEMLGERTSVDGNEDNTSSLIDLGQFSTVAAPSAGSKDDLATDPSAPLPSGAVVDPDFDKAWGKAMKSSRKSDNA